MMELPPRDRYGILKDGQNSVRKVVDTTGAVVASYDYTAFGEVLNQSQPSGWIFNHRAFGEIYDPNLEMTYLRARWMDPGTGRFGSRDPFGGRARDPRTLHRYSYAGTSPVNKADPTGAAFGDKDISSQQTTTYSLGLLAQVEVHAKEYHLVDVNHVFNCGDPDQNGPAQGCLVGIPSSERSFYYSGADPQQRFVYFEVLEIIRSVADDFFADNGVRVGVGNSSLPTGQSAPPHSSHVNGRALDFRLMRKDHAEAGSSIGDASYDHELTKDLIDRFIPYSVVIWFNDQTIPGVRKQPNHDDHFHVDFAIAYPYLIDRGLKPSKIWWRR